LLTYIENYSLKLRLLLAVAVILISLVAVVGVGAGALSSLQTNATFSTVFARLLEMTARLENELQEDVSGKRSVPALVIKSRYRDTLTKLTALRATAESGPATGRWAALDAEYGVEPTAERARHGLDERPMPSHLRALWRERDISGRTLEDTALEFLTLMARVLDASGNYEEDHAKLLGTARNLSEIKLFPAFRRALRINNDHTAQTSKFALYAMIAGTGAVILALVFGTVFIVRPMYRQILENEAHLVGERDRARASERDNREFLAVMSHELRTPMNGLLGFTTLLLGTKLDSVQREYAETIRESGQGLVELLNDILDLSRMEMNSLELEEENLSLAEIVADVVTLLGPQASSKRIDLSAYVDPDLPEQVRGDRGRVRQILVNLVGNALKFTVSGGVGVEVRHESGEDGGDHVVIIAVSDTGIGIAKDQLSRIFDRFTQVDNSSSRRFEGSGLGLAISQQLARLMGGEISVESTPDKGSTFAVRLSLKSATPPSPRIIDRTQVSFAGRRFLVVDDNALNRRIYRLQLEAFGAEVDCVPDAHAALAVLSQSERRGPPFDVAIIDQMMPEIDGITLRRMIRDRPEHAGVKLLISSSGGIGYDQQARALGFDAACPKPVMQEKLVRKIQELIAPSGTASEARIARLPAKPAPPPSLPATQSEHQPRLLIAEDNPINQRLISVALKQAGFTIEIVGDGVEAVHAVQRQHYDVVLMDIRMPVMNGVEATRRIRSLPGEASSLPIIAMTANAMIGDREEYIGAGMNDYVAKPIDFNILLAKIRAHLPVEAAETVAETADPVAWKPEALRGGSGIA
jgi:signal transduction histidine kinase/DNA-binding response OmpR family regulator